MDLSIHNATEMRVAMHSTGNANSINLQFKSRDGLEDLWVYGLPESVTSKLLWALADDDTQYITSEPLQAVVAEPEPLDAETVAARDEHTERQIIDAGRGELAR